MGTCSRRSCTKYSRKCLSLACLLLLLPLLLWHFFDPCRQSLLPHDESLYVSRARLLLNTGDLWTPFPQAHHKTPGFYWAVALSIRFLGFSDATVRLPAVLLALLAAWLVFQLGVLVLNRRAAAMAVAVLGTSYLWAVHSRTVSPDMAYITCFLGGTLLLAQDLIRRKTSSVPFSRWRLLVAGCLLALTVFLRSVLALLPLLGLTPWLLQQQRGRRLLTNPWLWLGLMLGAAPTLIWLGKSLAAYNLAGLTTMLNFPLTKATQTGIPGSGFRFYPVSLLVNLGAWGLLLPMAITSQLRTWNTRFHQRWLLLMPPATMLLLLMCTSSHYHHYALPLYPFMALLIAADLNHRLEHAATGKAVMRPLQIVAAGQIGLAGALLVLLARDQLPLNGLHLPVTLLSGGWLLGTCVLLWHSVSREFKVKTWIVLQIATAWAVLLSVIHTGLIGDYSHAEKAFVMQPEVQEALATGPVDLVMQGGRKTTDFLKAYSPHVGEVWPSMEAFENRGNGMAWILRKDQAQLSLPYDVLAQGEKVLLIRLQP